MFGWSITRNSQFSGSFYFTETVWREACLISSMGRRVRVGQTVVLLNIEWMLLMCEALYWPCIGMSSVRSGRCEEAGRREWTAAARPAAITRCSAAEGTAAPTQYLTSTSCISTFRSFSSTSFRFYDVFAFKSKKLLWKHMHCFFCSY